MHACKIADFTGIHLNVSLSVLIGFNEMLCLFKHRWICHHSSPKFQDIVNVLAGRYGCLLKAGVSTTATNLPSTFKSENIQASRFHYYSDRCFVKEIRFSLIVIGTL